MVLVLFYREALVGVIRKLGTDRGVFIQARPLGKLKTFTQATAIGVTLIIALVRALSTGEGPAELGDSVRTPATALMWAAVGVTVLSAVDYTWANRHLFRGGEETGA
jgi:phosphatidylglycerophosphate synthase